MRAAVHVIPCAGILAAAGAKVELDSGIATMAIRTAERLEEPADLVLLAVPAGRGEDVAGRLQRMDRGPAPAPPRPRTALGDELDADDEVLVGADAATPARGRNRRAPLSG